MNRPNLPDRGTQGKQNSTAKLEEHTLRKKKCELPGGGPEFMLALVGRQDVEALHHDAWPLGRILNAQDCLGDNLAGDLVIGADVEEIARRDDGTLGRFERLPKRIDDYSWFICFQ